MLYNVVAVHPHVRFIVRSGKAQQRALVFFADRKFAFIPNCIVHGSIAYSARLPLIRKRHVDITVVILLIAEPELPFAVQALPYVAPELRAGVFFSFIFHFVVSSICHIQLPQSGKRG